MFQVSTAIGSPEVVSHELHAIQDRFEGRETLQLRVFGPDSPFASFTQHVDGTTDIRVGLTNIVGPKTYIVVGSTSIHLPQSEARRLLEALQEADSAGMLG